MRQPLTRRLPPAQPVRITSVRAVGERQTPWDEEARRNDFKIDNPLFPGQLAERRYRSTGREGTCHELLTHHKISAGRREVFKPRLVDPLKPPPRSPPIDPCSSHVATADDSSHRHATSTTASVQLGYVTHTLGSDSHGDTEVAYYYAPL